MNDSGFAFPSNGKVYKEGVGTVDFQARGMTLMDWFAGQALVGLLPAGDPQGMTAYTEMSPDEIAASAYKIADAMIEARRKF